MLPPPHLGMIKRPLRPFGQKGDYDMHVVIFAAGTVQAGKAVRQTIASAELVIAADRGAATALQYGRVPAVIVGDFDSLDALSMQKIQEQGSQTIQVPVEKDETDTELAIDTAIQHGATNITLLGALGGARFDHTMANILLLADFQNVALRIVDGPTTCWLLRSPGHTSIDGEAGDLLSLFPLTADAVGITTTNLYYPLHNNTLRFGKPRGASNALTQPHAEVSLSQGLLLLIHTDVHELRE
jgi:thiamine pyrophosphokinase